MHKRVMTVAAGAALCLGAFAAGQAPPFKILQADSVSGEAVFGDSAGRTVPVTRRSTLTGNVLLEVNGLLVRADRAVADHQSGEIRLEGNVRLTLPKVK